MRREGENTGHGPCSFLRQELVKEWLLTVTRIVWAVPAGKMTFEQKLSESDSSSTEDIVGTVFQEDGSATAKATELDSCLVCSCKQRDSSGLMRV